MNEANPYEVAYEREKAARKAAEKLLDEKTREVYNSMLIAQHQNEDLMAQKKELELLVSLTTNAGDYRSFTEGTCFYIKKVSELFESSYAYAYKCNHNIKHPLNSSKFECISNDRFQPLLNQLRVSDQSYCPEFSAIVSKDSQAHTLDVADLHDQYKDLYLSYDIHHLTLIPIFKYDKIVAIVELGQQARVKNQERFLKAVVTASHQLSILLERRETEKKLKSNYAQLQEAHAQLQTAQTQLVQSEKMASIGQLAAGVAHEINNPIGFVMSNMGTLQEYVDILKSFLASYSDIDTAIESDNLDQAKALVQANKISMEDEDSEFILEDINSIFKDGHEGLGRVKDIVANLKSFARADEGELQTACVNDIIDNTIKVVWNEIKYKAELIKDYQKVPKIHCNAGQIGQVFMNLLINAAQAIEDNGKITISTECKDNEVHVSVEDNGHGIPNDVKNKIFDPFFTTKPVDIGTGLGLSISYGIIEQHNGTITLESQSGVGTCFTISLPC